jgi:two-component system LytT family response regulator
MTDIRTLIVDDEPVARSRLIGLLKAEPDLTVVGECADGVAAVSAIDEVVPDLVFLDVQMPELNGFDVTRAVGPDRMPVVVFVTAYDEYALQAFEVHAVDYLLKPFSAERLKLAVMHARSLVAQRRASSLNEQLLAMLPEPRPRSPYRDRILIKSSGRIYFVRTSDIDWCEAAGNYIRLHTGREEHLIRDTMTRFESELDPHRFVRIHRSTIVNMDRIQEMRPLFNGEYLVQLQSGARLTMSRGHREALATRLGTRKPAKEPR